MHIETKRLVIKPFSEEDKANAIKLFVNDRIKQTYMLPDFQSEEEAKKLFYRLKELSLSEEHYVAGIYRDHKLIGFLNDVEIAGDKIEMGYVIDPKCHNQGYATEAMQGVIGYLFDDGFTEVITGAFESNIPSIKVMQKCGMARLEKEEDIEYRGRMHHCIYYSAKYKK